MLPKTGCSLALLTLACSAILPAQVMRFEGQRIVAIEYSPAPTLDPLDLASAQPLHQGDILHARDVAEAIDSLFATGRFQNIAVEADSAGTAGVVIRFVTQPQLFVGGVAVEGKFLTPPDRTALESNGQIGLGMPFREDDVTAAVQRMTRLFQTNGLYEASVEPKIERPGGPNGEAQQVFITFQVRPGKRAKYDMPDIQGAGTLSEATILRVTGWRLPLIHWWRKVSSARTRSGVQKLLARYQKQDRLLARVELEKLDYDEQRRRVTPHLNITPGPKVKITSIEDKVSGRVLKRYVPAFQEHDVDSDLLVEGKRNLHDYLQSQGYFDVDVDFRIQPPENDLETIQYVISKGQRFRLVNLTILGNKYFDQNTIRERMFIAPSAFNLRRGRYSDAFRRRDEASIADLYKANGFRDVKVTTEVVKDFKSKTGDVGVTVSIAEGRQWVVDNLSVDGVAASQRKDVLANLMSVAGQPFSEVSLASDRDAVLTWYYTNGYPDASFKADWHESDTPAHADVHYAVVEGRRQYVRQVVTHGLRTTRQSLIDKTIGLKPGEPISPVQQIQIQKRLYDLGIFARVDTAIENPAGDTSHKFVLYDFEEANRYTVNLGFGAQVARFGKPSSKSLGSPAGTTGFSPEASFSVSRLNFFGRGHTATLHVVYSSIEKSGSLSYQQPRFLNSANRNITYSIVHNEERDVRTFASKRDEGSVQVSQTFSKSLTGMFRFAYRRVSASQIVIPVLLIPQLLQPVRIGMLSSNFVRDRRDNPGNARRGSLNSVDIRLAGKFFGSQRSFGAALVRNATYHRLTKNFVLARQTQFGIIAPFAAPAGLNDQQSVPLPERYFAGGADSLRAFAFNEAGPRDTGAPLVPGGPTSRPTGFPLGGNALFTNNIELRFPLLGENIQGVFFHDMGNVFTSIGNMSLRMKQKNLQDFNYTAHAAGFGIRYQTPVGPIRVDLAYTLNPPSFEGFAGTPQQLLSCDPNDPATLTKAACQVTQQTTGHLQFFFSIGQTF